MGRTDVSAEVGTVEEICRMIDLVSDTMDDYLYICDFQNDFYYILSTNIETQIVLF